MQYDGYAPPVVRLRAESSAQSPSGRPSSARFQQPPLLSNELRLQFGSDARARRPSAASRLESVSSHLKRSTAGQHGYAALSFVAYASRALLAAMLLAMFMLSLGFMRKDPPSSPPPAQANNNRRDVTTPRALGVAPPATALPPICVVKPSFHPWRDRDCYLESERTFLEEYSRDVRAPYCWGSSGDSSPVVFHTVALSDLPSATPMLIDSFLATQCCDAVLWLWVAGPVLDAARAEGRLPPVPLAHAHRVQFRTLDVAALFADVRDDFPDVNDTAAAAMLEFEDIRFRANWARILILYTHGGVYVDLDTMFLRDFRPLFNATPGAFTYRQGSEIIMNIAVLKLYRRPHAVMRDLLASAAIRHRVSQSHLSLMMRPWDNNSPWRGNIDYISLSLFDIMWFPFLASTMMYTADPETNARDVQTPELAARIAAQGPLFTPVNNWDAFFKTLPADEVDSVRGGAHFFPGSFSYHWHNR